MIIPPQSRKGKVFFLAYQLTANATDSCPSPGMGELMLDLYFESPSGFGKWRLLCSNRCLRALTRDREQSRLALTKLEYVLIFGGDSRNCVTSTMPRELSCGNFSEANQKRLTRDSPVDIFRARLPGDLRLVVSRHLISTYDLANFSILIGH